MDKNNIFWLVIWTLVAIVLICGFHGCRKMYEADCQTRTEMAERGYEYIGGNWIRR